MQLKERKGNLTKELQALKEVRKKVKAQKQSIKMQRKLTEDSAHQKQKKQLDEQIKEVRPSFL